MLLIGVGRDVPCLLGNGDQVQRLQAWGRPSGTLPGADGGLLCAKRSWLEGLPVQGTPCNQYQHRRASVACRPQVIHSLYAKTRGSMNGAGECVCCSCMATCKPALEARPGDLPAGASTAWIQCRNGRLLLRVMSVRPSSAEACLLEPLEVQEPSPRIVGQRPDLGQVLAGQPTPLKKLDSIWPRQLVVMVCSKLSSRLQPPHTDAHLLQEHI